MLGVCSGRRIFLVRSRGQAPHTVLRNGLAGSYSLPLNTMFSAISHPPWPRGGLIDTPQLLCVSRDELLVEVLESRAIFDVRNIV